MGMAAILLNGAEQFEQIVDIPISFRQKSLSELCEILWNCYCCFREDV